MRLLYQCALALMLGLAASVGYADRPDRSVRLIVGFPPGGAADILGRATEIAARANPDGARVD